VSSRRQANGPLTWSAKFQLVGALFGGRNWLGLLCSDLIQLDWIGWDWIERNQIGSVWFGSDWSGAY